MSRRWIAAAAALASVATAALVTSAQPTAATTPVPREHRVLVLSDSVGLGARDSIPAAFPADWEVNVRGQPARFVQQLENGPCFWTYTNRQCAVVDLLAYEPHLFGDHVVIAAGYNYPYWNPEFFASTVDSLINRLTNAGVKHVYWVTLRDLDPQYMSASAWRQIQQYYKWQPVNDQLEAALYRHPNLTLIDWAANANQPNLTYDAIHLNPTGAALYAALVRDAVYGTATTVADGSTTEVDVPGGAGSSAAAINLTTTHPRRAGHLVVHRCDESPPTASVHNFVRTQVVAHAAIAPLDDDGTFCVTTHSATNLIVDVTGLFGADEGFDATTPTRWADTRAANPVAGGTMLELDVADIPASAGIVGVPDALALIVTATRATGLGHVTVSACDPDADHSNLNYTSANTPNLVVTAPDDDGKVCFYAATTTDLIVDVLGAFDNAEEAPPVVDVGSTARLFDSRKTDGPVTPGEPVRIDLTEHLSDASNSAVLNVTSVLAANYGHFTVFPCDDGAGNTSNLNYRPFDVVANAVIIAPDANGEVCVSTHAESHMIVDLLGEIGDVFTGQGPTRVLDTRHN